MPSVHRLLWGMLVLFGVGAVHAAPRETPTTMTLSGTSRVYVTLVPRAADPDEANLLFSDALASGRPSLNLPLGAARRNRLEFSLARTDVVARGDRLRLRLASDAHVIAQLLSGGQFSEADDSWIAVVGLASRVRLSYELGPWELSVSAKRRFGQGDVRARLSYAIRF